MVASLIWCKGENIDGEYKTKRDQITAIWNEGDLKQKIDKLLNDDTVVDIKIMISRGD